MKAVKVAVSIAMRNVSAAPRGASAARRVGRTTRCVCHTMQYVGRSRHPRGLRDPQGGVLYMKNFYGLELPKNHFIDKVKKL